MIRYYQQTAADFYGVRFTGSPSTYSSDYRLSNLTATSLGLKLLYQPNDDWSFDISYERYNMEGQDSITHPDAYPSANIVTIGFHRWF